MEGLKGLVDVAPPIITAVVTALVGWLVIRRKEQSEIRLLDAQTLNEWRDFERDTSEMLLKLNNDLIEERLKRVELENYLEQIKQDYERRIQLYKSQIRNLERRIQELENGKGLNYG